MPRLLANMGLRAPRGLPAGSIDPQEGALAPCSHANWEKMQKSSRSQNTSAGSAHRSGKQHGIQLLIDHPFSTQAETAPSPPLTFAAGNRRKRIRRRKKSALCTKYTVPICAVFRFTPFSAGTRGIFRAAGHQGCPAPPAPDPLPAWRGSHAHRCPRGIPPGCRRARALPRADCP